MESHKDLAPKVMKVLKVLFKIFVYVVCISLAILSIMPFWIMLMNATRSTTEIQQHAISLLPSGYLLNNLKILLGKSFNPINGFINSMIVSTGSTPVSYTHLTLPTSLSV